ncbi:ribokinase [Caballeronia sp. LjRoot31]|uniref:ribokinase n=1 Tax=Caballeronia sp. LjRoot31 TaxID=3342324 RepID=UPI003ECC7ADF
MSKEAQQGRVVVVGSINTDLVAQTTHLPFPGETLGSVRFLQASGGKGANQAVAAARFGAHVSMVARVGDDENGDQRLEDLEAEGIDCSGITVTPERPTGLALITVSQGGQNTVVVVDGSNGELKPADVWRQEALFRDADVVVCQLETPAETTYASLQLARQLGKITILNPAPAIDPLPSEWLSLTDYLVVNEVEALILSDIPFESESDMGRAAQQLQRQGACNVIVTLGARGTYLLQEGGGGRLFLAPRVEAVDTTAAGDTFIGVLAAQLASRHTIAKSIERGQLAAAISVTRRGGQTSIPTRDEVED